MVYRYKNFNDPPAEFCDTKWDDLKGKVLIEKGAHQANSNCYRDATIEKLKDIYKNKCAICERDRGFELQVDHYRPKKSRNHKHKTEYNQPGYYWLCYTWSNLIPLCSKCNGNKSSKFPLKDWDENFRIKSHLNINGYNPFEPYCPKWLKQEEKPLLINPEVDVEPHNNFSFKSNGEIIGNSPEGKETIKVFKLNRKDLIRERQKIREDYVKRIKSALNDYEGHKDKGFLKGELTGVFKELEGKCHPDEGFSFYHLFLYKYFDHFIDRKLPINLRGLATKYFDQFKSLK